MAEGAATSRQSDDVELLRFLSPSFLALAVAVGFVFIGYHVSFVDIINDAFGYAIGVWALLRLRLLSDRWGTIGVGLSGILILGPIVDAVGWLSDRPVVLATTSGAYVTLDFLLAPLRIAWAFTVFELPRRLFQRTSPAGWTRAVRIAQVTSVAVLALKSALFWGTLMAGAEAEGLFPAPVALFVEIALPVVLAATLLGAYLTCYQARVRAKPRMADS